MPSDETDGIDDADLPGLDDAPAQPVEPERSADASDAPAEAPGEAPTTSENVPEAEWSRAELDEWFENDFGGDDGYWDALRSDGFSRVTAESHPDLHFGLTAYRQLYYDNEREQNDEGDPWRVMSLEAKTRFRRGWENTRAPAGSAVGELAPYDAMETLVDARHKLDGSRSTLPRWVWIGGGFGLLGLVLVVGFVLLDGDGDEEDGAPATVATVASTAPPSTEAAITDETQVTTADTTAPSTVAAIVDDTQAPAVAVDTPDPPAVPFPTRWSYTATKVADIVPAPSFMTPTPIGTALPWAFDVFETCGDTCGYTTVVYPLIPESLLGEVPEATWTVDGDAWSLDVTYQTVQSRYGDGTVCVIRNQDLFDLTVATADVDGRSVPATFTGSWIQATSLDLEASTGDTASYCGEPWQVVDEWSLEGVAAG